MQNNELLTPNEIIRSRRKSLSLVIKNNGEFIVRAPLNMKENDIYKFIIKKQDWVIKKRLEQSFNRYQPLTFQQPETLNILGKPYNIVLSQTSKVNLCEHSIEVPANNSKEKLVVFLKRYARKHFTERCNLIANLFNFDYSKITISSAKTCWGSCSHNNTLHFTYKLIMCPEDVVDYIILHELCHTKVKNHSTKFWALVEACCPNYKTHEKWLKKNRGIIEIV